MSAEACHGLDRGCRCRNCREELAGRGWGKRRRRLETEGGRRGGIQSGIVRRRLARRRRGIPPGVDRRLQLTYESRRLGRAEFNRGYIKAHGPVPPWPAARIQWERARELRWQNAQGWFRLRCVRGQYCRETNEQRARGLEKRWGRKPSVRTVQRCNRSLEAMGVAKLTGRSRWDAERGRWTGYVVLEWHLTRRVRGELACHAPSGNGEPSPRSSGVPRRSGEVPPPTAAGRAPPDKPAERLGTDEGVDAAPGGEPVAEDEERAEALEAEIRFQRQKLELGFGGSSDAVRLRGRERLRQAELELGQLRARIRSTTSRGFKCSM